MFVIGFMFISLVLQTSDPMDPIESVQNATLDIESDETVGKAFSTYRWFATGKWEQVPITVKRSKVTFRGEWPDPPAVEDFHERFRFSPKMALKGMQLHTYYNLSKEKDRLAFLVDFLVEPDGSFAVIGGRLGIRHQDQTWRYEKLTNKALLHIIEGIYANENPYVSLCKGLPFK